MFSCTPLAEQARMRWEGSMKGVVLPGIGLALILLTSADCLGQTTAADKQRQTAIALEQQGEYVDAEAAWRAFLKAQPANAEAYAHLGFLEAQQERYRQAIPLYRKALALS